MSNQERYGKALVKALKRYFRIADSGSVKPLDFRGCFKVMYAFDRIVFSGKVAILILTKAAKPFALVHPMIRLLAGDPVSKYEFRIIDYLESPIGDP